MIDKSNKKMITGSVSFQAGEATIAQPLPPHTYFGVAQSLMKDIIVLSQSSNIGIGLPLLCAHALECILKSYLSRNGSDKYLKKPDIRHDLVKLWEMALEQGLQLSKEPPSWVVCLGELHSPPYQLRYSTGIHGIVTPNTQHMASELRKLFETVQKNI